MNAALTNGSPPEVDRLTRSMLHYSNVLRWPRADTFYFPHSPSVRPFSAFAQILANPLFASRNGLHQGKMFFGVMAQRRAQKRANDAAKAASEDTLVRPHSAGAGLCVTSRDR